MSQQITHSGVVRAVEDAVVSVAIVASSACQSCRAKLFCGISESQEKIIRVKTSQAATYRVGDEVEVGEEQQIAFRALAVAYIGALGVLLGVLFLALALGIGEGWAALLSFVGLGLYYLGVYLRREKIEKTIHFTIIKK